MSLQRLAIAIVSIPATLVLAVTLFTFNALLNPRPVASEASLPDCPLTRALWRNFQLVLVVGAARRERLLGAAKGLVDILLEIILEEGEGPDEPGEILL